MRTLQVDPAVDLDRHVYGERGAPVTVVEHGDFQCPYCRAAAPVLKELVDGSGARVRLVFRHFPLFTVHPFALTAALAAEAGGDRFWQLHDLLFAHQDRLTDADLTVYADSAGVTGAVGVPGVLVTVLSPAPMLDMGAPEPPVEVRTTFQF